MSKDQLYALRRCGRHQVLCTESVHTSRPLRQPNATPAASPVGCISVTNGGDW